MCGLRRYGNVAQQALQDAEKPKGDASKSSYESGVDASRVLSIQSIQQLIRFEIQIFRLLRKTLQVCGRLGDEGNFDRWVGIVNEV